MKAHKSLSGDRSVLGIAQQTIGLNGSAMNATLYINGQSLGAVAMESDVDLSAANTSAIGGGYDGGSAILGNIAHFGVWHSALTQSQVRALMTASTYTEAVTRGGSTPRAYYLLEANVTDSVGTQNGTAQGNAAPVGNLVRLPSGLDLTSSQLNAQVFSGRAVTFDGTGDQLIGSGPNIASTGAWSVSCWVKSSDTSTQYLFVGFGASSNTAILYLNYSGNVAHWGTGDSSPTNICSSATLLDGMWHNLVFTISGGTSATVYIDGKSAGTATVTSQDLSSMATVHISGVSSNSINGSLSDFKIYSGTALSAAQVLEQYENPELLIPSGVTAGHRVAHWPLSDFDISGAGNIGGLYLQDIAGSNPLLATNCGMEFAQPACPQLGLRSSTSRSLFNDSNSRMRLSPSGTDIDCPGAFTYLFWLQTFTANGDARILDANAGSGMVIFIDSADAGYVRVRTKISFGGSYHTWDTPNNVVPIGGWVHLGITFAGGDSNEVVYYINGSSVTVTNPAGTPSGTQGADDGIKDIGGTGASQIWDGYISEFAIFAGTVLDADAVAAVYNSGNQGFDLLTDSGNYDNSGDLDGWWKIDNPETVFDLKGSTNGTWNNLTHLGTVPEGSTAGLSSFGTLTTDRPSFAFAQPPVGDSAANRDANPFAGGFRTPPGSYYGTGAFSITFWFRPTQGSSMTNGIIYKNNSYDGVVIKQTSATNLRVEFNGDDNDVTVNCASGATMVNQWTMVCAQRIASDSLKVWTRKAGDASWATATSSTAPGDMTPTDTGMVCNWMGDGGGADFRNNPGAMCAFPRVWYTTALTESQLDTLFESGQRMLIGGNT